MPNLSTDLHWTILSTALLDEMHDAVIVGDLDGRIRLWNKGAERIYGWRSAEVTGRSAYDVLFPANTDELNECTRALAETGEWTGELRQLTRDGKTLVVEGRWKHERDVSYRPTGIWIVHKDITEKKLLEGRMVVAQRIETVGRLATSLAHDLNNVLSAMLMSLRTLAQEGIDEKPNVVIKSSQFCAEHATELITQLLSIAKEIDAVPKRLWLGELIKEIGSLLESTFPQTIKIEILTPAELRPIVGNATHLYQLLLNLSLNARDAMPSGGVLTIEASNVVLDDMTARRLQAVAGDYVVLKVADTGTGIPAEIIPQVFEPFFTTKHRDRGTGLGLFTAANIVKNHHGFIELNPGTERGTQFIVYLPAEKTYC